MGGNIYRYIYIYISSLFTSLTEHCSGSICSYVTERQVLGPFAVGARELGVDPLSAYGGFESLPYSDTDEYPSELADGCKVRWSRVYTNSDHRSVGPLDFPEIRWRFNQDPFGWTSLHHATYFRGSFRVQKSGVYLVNFDSVVSFKIDKRAFIGNVYGYEHASGSAVYLEEGEHKLYFSAIMDVRLFGGYNLLLYCFFFFTNWC